MVFGVRSMSGIGVVVECTMKRTNGSGQVVACRVGGSKQRVGSEIVSDVRRMDKEKVRKDTARMAVPMRGANLWGVL